MQQSGQKDANERSHRHRAFMASMPFVNLLCRTLAIDLHTASASRDGHRDALLLSLFETRQSNGSRKHIAYSATGRFAASITIYAAFLSWMRPITR
jgi:hypothetical protein